MSSCEKCGKEFNVDDLIWECNRVELAQLAQLDKENDTYEIGNIDYSVRLCDDCFSD